MKGEYVCMYTHTHTCVCLGVGEMGRKTIPASVCEVGWVVAGEVKVEISVSTTHL